MDLNDDSSSAERAAAGDPESGASSSTSRAKGEPEEECESDEDAADGEDERGAADHKGDTDDDDDDVDAGYDSDTQIVRIAESAASFARHCIACGEFSKALVALQNVVEIAEPPSPAYTQCVLLLVQLFQLTKHFDASLATMMDVFKCLPAPYTPSDGLVIIARLYELKGAPDFAAFWWNKLLKQQGTSLNHQQLDANYRAKALEDFANQCFEQRDFVFALDGFAEIFLKYRAYYHDNRKSYALMFKHLHSALQVLDPEANHKLERQRLAWELAMIACHHHQDHAGKLSYKNRYGDADFYNLRNVYFASFPAIYRAVFARDDAPARAIAQWWRARREHRLQQQQQQLREDEREKGDEKQPVLLQPNSRRAKTTTKKKEPTAADAKPARSQVRGRASGKTSEASPPKSPCGMLNGSPLPSSKYCHEAPSFKVSHKRSSSKRALGAISSEKQHCASTRGVPAREGEAEAIQQTNQSEERGEDGTSIETRSPSSSRVAQQLGRHFSLIKRRERGGGRLSRQQHRSDEFYENSPTKRRLSAVRHLREQNLVDELLDLQLSKPPPTLTDESPKDADQEEEDISPQRTTSLLELYALPSPIAAESFLASAGRALGFADLDLDELEKYVRVAHYRARVLIQKHVDVKQLEEERVKPQWLLSFEKTEAMIVDLRQQQEQQQSLADDTTAATAKPHLTQIHSRVVFQLTAIFKQYKRDFGDTSFTRHLHALIQRLSTWKYDQIPVLLAVMESAKKAGVREEKQRNLEFFHVHQGRQQQPGECS